MRIKSFYANTMDLALQTASREMGDEALILNSREAPHEFRHFGKYEVVCACAQEVQLPEAGAFPRAPERPQTPACTESPAETIAEARMVAIVGPNGAGKTSACAKIAIQAKFTLGLSVAVITWDTGRIGASECLRAYCEIADIPYKEVESPSDFEDALTELSSTQICVVDTPSLNRTDSSATPVVQSLAGRPNTEIHLVVSSASSSSYLESVVERYSAFQPGFLLPTHLDDSLLALSDREMDCLKALRVKWCSTGPAVPEDLADAAKFLEQARDLMLPAAPIASPPQQATYRDRELRSGVEKILMRYRKGDFESTLQRKASISAA